jgi:hypothetical protein
VFEADEVPDQVLLPACSAFENSELAELPCAPNGERVAPPSNNERCTTVHDGSRRFTTPGPFPLLPQNMTSRFKTALQCRSHAPRWEPRRRTWPLLLPWGGVSAPKDSPSPSASRNSHHVHTGSSCTAGVIVRLSFWLT